MGLSLAPFAAVEKRFNPYVCHVLGTTSAAVFIFGKKANLDDGGDDMLDTIVTHARRMRPGAPVMILNYSNREPRDILAHLLVDSTRPLCVHNVVPGSRDATEAFEWLSDELL